MRAHPRAHLPRAHTCTGMHVHESTRAYPPECMRATPPAACVHTCKTRHTRAWTHMSMHVSTPARLHARTVHAGTQGHKHRRARAYQHTCVHTGTRAHLPNTDTPTHWDHSAAEHPPRGTAMPAGGGTGRVLGGRRVPGVSGRPCSCSGSCPARHHAPTSPAAGTMPHTPLCPAALCPCLPAAPRHPTPRVAELCPSVPGEARLWMLSLPCHHTGTLASCLPVPPGASQPHPAAQPRHSTAQRPPQPHSTAALGPTHARVTPQPPAQLALTMAPWGSGTPGDPRPGQCDTAASSARSRVAHSGVPLPAPCAARGPYRGACRRCALASDPCWPRIRAPPPAPLQGKHAAW